MSRHRSFPFAHSLSRFLRFILSAAAIAFSARTASSQSGITEGSRVQISASWQKKVTGIVRSVSNDSTSIFVDGQGGVLKFANADITELKLSRGRTRLEGVKKGLIWGGAIGGALAVAIAAAPEPNRDYEYQYASNKSIALNTFMGSLMWGAGLGALIKAEQWEKSPVRATIGASSGGRGLSFGFSPAFLH